MGTPSKSQSGSQSGEPHLEVNLGHPNRDPIWGASSVKQSGVPHLGINLKQPWIPFWGTPSGKQYGVAPLGAIIIAPSRANLWDPRLRAHPECPIWMPMWEPIRGTQSWSQSGEPPSGIQFGAFHLGPIWSAPIKAPIWGVHIQVLIWGTPSGSQSGAPYLEASLGIPSGSLSGLPHLEANLGCIFWEPIEGTPILAFLMGANLGFLLLGANQ